ncbi:tetratricopeptide repeat protein 12-like [Saccostrea cucullata]|uniref:tetratricopeptide repeat protein 12-like n=1 Tax=Saccostrea cuccullata TaxID=36930 RepID=UPI002ED43497
MAGDDITKDSKKLDEFINKVDEIETLVKTLKYGEDKDVKQAMQKADEIIAKNQAQLNEKLNQTEDEEEESKEPLPSTKTGFSKTVINKSPSTAPPPSGPQPMAPPDQLGFMAAMEADARERAERRKVGEKKANELKEKGNEEFRQGNYEKALEFYTEGLTHIKDHLALWTNKAQTNIKLGRYEDALVDCDWAIRVFNNSMKAHVLMGKANLGLRKYKEAREAYKKALECDPTKQNLINDYLAEVDRAERTQQEEDKAKEAFQAGDKGPVALLQQLQKKDQLPIYYSGGFQIMQNFLKNNEERTLFRTEGGFQIVNEHPCFSKCFSASPKSLSKEELDMLNSGLCMFSLACEDNEKNQEVFLCIEGMPDKLMRFMEVKMKGLGRVLKSSCVKILHTVTISVIGRSLVFQKFDISRLLTIVFNLIRANDDAALTAGCVLNNLALDNKFKQQLRDKIEISVIPAFENLLKEGSSKQSVLPSCVSTITNLSTDVVIRKKISDRKDLWKILLDTVSNHKQKLPQPISVELVEACLGLISNLTHEQTSMNFKEFSLPICKQCLMICQSLKHYKLMVSRSLGILSHILPYSIPSVDWFCDNVGVEVLVFILKNDEESANRKFALKALTGCTQINDHARIFVVDHKGLGTLIKQLQCEDETVIGNAALCLSHCTQVPKVCAALAKTDIIKDLLVLARDGKKSGLQQNCAILIAKLAQGDKRHLERLRELHGIDILHDCMKYLK